MKRTQQQLTNGQFYFIALVGVIFNIFTTAFSWSYYSQYNPVYGYATAMANILEAVILAVGPRLLGVRNLTLFFSSLLLLIGTIYSSLFASYHWQLDAQNAKKEEQLRQTLTYQQYQQATAEVERLSQQPIDGTSLKQKQAQLTSVINQLQQQLGSMTSVLAKKTFLNGLARNSRGHKVYKNQQAPLTILQLLGNCPGASWYHRKYCPKWLELDRNIADETKTLSQQLTKQQTELTVIQQNLKALKQQQQDYRLARQRQERLYQKIEEGGGISDGIQTHSEVGFWARMILTLLWEGGSIWCFAVLGLASAKPFRPQTPPLPTPEGGDGGPNNGGKKWWQRIRDYFWQSASNSSSPNVAPTPAPIFTPEPTPAAATLEPLPAALTAQKMAQNIPEAQTLLNPWLHAGNISMISAGAGVGKTFVTLGIAHAIATGSRFLRWQAAAPQKVLFVDGEMGRVELNKRLNLLPNLGQYEANLFLLPYDIFEDRYPNITTLQGQAIIERYIGSCSLIILDNLKTLSQGAIEYPKSYAAFQSWLQSLRQRGFAILFAHHNNKSGRQGGSDDKRVLLNTEISLSHPNDYRPEQGARFIVHFAKSRGLFGHDVADFEAQLIEGQWHWHDPNQPKIITTQNKGLYLVSDHGNQVPPPQNIPRNIPVTEGNLARQVENIPFDIPNNFAELDREQQVQIVSQLYESYGNQNTVAAKLGITQGQVSKLLKKIKTA